MASVLKSLGLANRNHYNSKCKYLYEERIGENSQQLSDEVEKNIVICQWREDQL